MSKYLKIKVNDNLNSLFNYINSCDHKLNWHDVITFALDYDCYKELYSNHFIINYLLHDHNLYIEQLELEKEKEN